jgi:hypothetical protein
MEIDFGIVPQGEVKCLSVTTLANSSTIRTRSVDDEEGEGAS